MEAYESARLEVVVFDQDVIVASGAGQSLINITNVTNGTGYDPGVDIVVPNYDPIIQPINWTNTTIP